MARINLGKVVPEKGVDYYTDEEKAEFKADIEEDVTALGETVTAQGTAIATLQLDSAHTIEMTLNSTTYELTLILKNKAGTALATQTINLPNENAITNIEYSNGKLIITKQSGTTIQVDISGLIEGLATETALTNLANALKETIGIDTNTYDNTKTYNTGDIVVQNEKIYKANQDNITGTFDSSKWDEISLYEYQKLQDETIEENYKVVTKLQEDVEDLTERVEDAENNEITNIPPPATSHYLQDSADSRFRKFIPIGRTTQESDPTLENPVPIKNTGDNVNLYDGNEINYTKGDSFNGNLVTDTNSRWYGRLDLDTLKLPLTISTYINCTTDNWNDTNIRLDFFDENNSKITTITGTSATSNNTRSVFVLSENIIPSGAKYITIKLRIQNSGYTEKTKIEQGTQATPYSPYGCGNVNEKISNKNLFTEKNMTSQSWLNGSGVATYISTAVTTDYIKVPLSRECVFSNINTAPTGYFAVNQYDANKNRITGAEYNTTTNFNQTFTLRENCAYIRISIYNYGKSSNNQLEAGTSKTDYVPHSEQTLSFPLAQGQKFYEGSYPDDDEKVHHKWGEYVLDGTVGGYNAEHNWFYISKGNITSNVKSFELLSNYFKNIVYASFESDNNLNGITWNSSILNNVTHLLIRNTNCNNATEYKNWLAEVLPKVQFPLAEEQTEDFTEEQKTAWKEWKKARTYKNVTHISSEDETPANVEIEYVVDINTIDDRITALTNAITSLGGNV